MTNSLLTCTPGFEQTTYISLRYQTSSNSEVNNARIFADLKVGEETQFLNYFFDVIPSATDLPKVLTLVNFPLSWTCGVEVRLNNPLLSWTTSASADLSQSYSCNSYPTAQCQFQSNIIVNAPLAVQFEYSYSCPENGKTPVAFTSTTNGGRAPYQYSWSFINAGTSSSNLANPFVDYYGPGEATLRVTDANGTVNTFQTNVVIPTSFDYNPEITHQTDEEVPNGSIKLEMNTLNELTFKWIGPNGFVSDQQNIYGLSEGTYQLTITDTFGCSETRDFVIDFFIILPLRLDDLTATILENDQKVTLNWTSFLNTGAGFFEIERSVYDISNFKVVGKLAITESSAGFTNYIFTDSTLPKLQTRIYYRIKLISDFGKSISGSTVMIEIPTGNAKQNWSAFPNPFENNLQLKYLGSKASSVPLTNIRIYSPSSFFTNQFSTNQNPVDLGNIIKFAPKGLLIIEIRYLNKVEVVKVIKK